MNSERLTVRLGWTVKYFPIFRQARPNFFRECLPATEKRRYNLNSEDKSLYSIKMLLLLFNIIIMHVCWDL